MQHEYTQAIRQTAFSIKDKNMSFRFDFYREFDQFFPLSLSCLKFSQKTLIMLYPFFQKTGE